MVSGYLEFRTRDGEKVYFAIEPTSAPPTQRAAAPGATSFIVSTADAAFQSALNTVSSIAKAFTEEVAQIPKRPDKVNLSFALEVNADLGIFAVAKAGAKTSLNVSLEWSSASDHGGS